MDSGEDPWGEGEITWETREKMKGGSPPLTDAAVRWIDASSLISPGPSIMKEGSLQKTAGRVRRTGGDSKGSTQDAVRRTQHKGGQ